MSVRRVCARYFGVTSLVSGVCARGFTTRCAARGSNREAATRARRAASGARAQPQQRQRRWRGGGGGCSDDACGSDCDDSGREKWRRTQEKFAREQNARAFGGK